MAALRKTGMNLAAISYDPVTVLAEFAERRGVTFPLLSDERSRTIKQYGILNTTVAESSSQYGIPFPGTFLLNRDAIVTSRYFEAAYQERNTMTSVLARLGGRVDVPATKVSASHVAITSFATDQIVAPGTLFSLVLDIVPEPRVHVYAPGVTGYKPIALAIEPLPHVVLRRPQYPKPTDYFFKPLKEHVPVFMRPFRITSDVMLSASRESEAALRDVSSLTLHGTLEYQACDDRVCFTPQTIPLQWTIAVKPLDRVRASGRR
jgi:AhpC/TSA family/Disulphide bond corrector protein DsbC